jgi:hypothetical protein
VDGTCGRPRPFGWPFGAGNSGLLGLGSKGGIVCLKRRFWISYGSIMYTSGSSSESWSYFHWSRFRSSMSDSNGGECGSRMRSTHKRPPRPMRRRNMAWLFSGIWIGGENGSKSFVVCSFSCEDSSSREAGGVNGWYLVSAWR